MALHVHDKTDDVYFSAVLCKTTASNHYIVQGRSQDFSKGGSHCVKHYRHGVFGTECCRLKN